MALSPAMCFSCGPPVRDGQRRREPVGIRGGRVAPGHNQGADCLRTRQKPEPESPKAETRFDSTRHLLITGAPWRQQWEADALSLPLLTFELKLGTWMPLWKWAELEDPPWAHLTMWRVSTWACLTVWRVRTCGVPVAGVMGSSGNRRRGPQVRGRVPGEAGGVPGEGG